MKNKIKIPENAISTYLPVFQGFYGSLWDNDYEFEGEAEHFGLPENFPFWEYADYEAWHNELGKDFCSALEYVLIEKGFVKGIYFEGIRSPREYNFSNDSVDCAIIPVPEVIAKYIYENKERFEAYLRRRLTSYDGFISFHSNQFIDWEINTVQFTNFTAKMDSKGFNLGFVLEFICEDEELFEEKLDHDWLYDKTYETRITEHYKPEFYEITDLFEEGNANSAFINMEFLTKERKYVTDTLLGSSTLSNLIEEVKSFTKENYTKENVLQLTLDKFEEYSDLLNTIKIVESAISEIESHTLQLKFK